MLAVEIEGALRQIVIAGGNRQCFIDRNALASDDADEVCGHREQQPGSEQLCRAFAQKAATRRERGF